MCSWELDTEPGPTGAILVLRITGDIDLLTVPVLQNALTTAVEQRPDDVVVDLAAVDFCAVRGYTLLDLAATTADRNGTRFVLSGLPRSLERVAARLWPAQHVVRYPSVAAAVTSIRTHQTEGMTSLGLPATAPR